MKIEFVTLETLIERNNKEFQYKEDLNIVRGLSILKLNKIYINLGALQWKSFLLLGEDKLIGAISKTIIHENMHLINFSIPDRICEIMAGQRNLLLVQKRYI